MWLMKTYGIYREYDDVGLVLAHHAIQFARWQHPAIWLGLMPLYPIRQAGSRLCDSAIGAICLRLSTKYGSHRQLESVIL